MNKRPGIQNAGKQRSKATGFSKDRGQSAPGHQERGHTRRPNENHLMVEAKTTNQGPQTPAFPAEWHLVATCSKGLEGVVIDELNLLKLPARQSGQGAVSFSGGISSMYQANLWLRSAMRILLLLSEGPADSRQALYELVSHIAWEELIGKQQTIVVEAVGRGEAFPNTTFAAMTVKDAIVDRLRQRWGFRPDVARENADVRIHLHLAGERASVSLDSSGEPLSHRGYRPRGGPAPLAETTAAGILGLAGYDGSQNFVDPMAGTGTIAIEAALVAINRAPGMNRSFACERWVFHAPGAIKSLREQARAGERAALAPILARDVDPRAVAAATRNAREAGVAQVVKVEQGRIEDHPVMPPGSLFVTNPPYGKRIGEEGELTSLYRSLGACLKHKLVGGTAYLLVGNRELAKHIGLQPSRRMVVYNGPIECRVLRFEIFSGSRRDRSILSPSVPTQ